MAHDIAFTEEEMAMDEGLGYPKAYAKLCRDRSFGPFSHGPPFTFTPYALSQQEEARARELDEMFPLIDLKANPTTKPKIFLSLLWKQLNHLGNAGFDPELIRVDMYGNVLYYHADAASPLAWDIDHWFPCSRGGFTVPSNLRILQFQVCKRKHNKLEFLIPWWDFQLGISINQFLSIFASSNSEFRHRAFSWLFYNGESEEVNDSQTVDSHIFPQHFLESKGKIGMAPAAVVLSRRESFDAPLKLRDLNRLPRSNTPIIAVRKGKGKEILKENENSLMATNPYQAIVMARDSLKQREKTAKMQTEIERLDNEVGELQQKTEEEKLSIQELELVLMKKRRRAEKCRKVAESQSSYRVMLEKMIREAMHQSVVYKEQVRLNQAAASALFARLEAQKAICDSAERELHKKHKQRDELEKQMRPEWEQARKRSRMGDTLNEEKDDGITTLCLLGNEPKTQEIEKNDVLCLPEMKPSTPPSLHKELRKFLEEEQRDSAGTLLQIQEQEENEEKPSFRKSGLDKKDTYIVEERLEKLEVEDGGKIYDIQFPFHHETEEDEESRRERGKGNIEKWLQFLLENSAEEADLNAQTPDKKEERLEKLEVEDGGKIYDIQFPFHHETEEDKESRRERGKGNIEKWLQFLLENWAEEADLNAQTPDKKEASKSDELIKKLNLIYPHTKIKISRAQESQCTEKTAKEIVKTSDLDKSDKKTISDDEKENVEVNVVKSNTTLKNLPYRIVPEKLKAKELAFIGKGAGRMSSPDEKTRREKNGKERELLRSESARAFRRIPSSPSLILEGMKKRVDCMGKMPLVLDDNNDEYENHGKNSFIKSSIKSIKRAVRI